MPGAADIRVGDRVLLNGKHAAIVRYIGPLQHRPDDSEPVYGLELEKPLGKHDGMFRGVRYYDARPLHGKFARRSRIAHFCPRQAGATPPPPRRGAGRRDHG